MKKIIAAIFATIIIIGQYCTVNAQRSTPPEDPEAVAENVRYDSSNEGYSKGLRKKVGNIKTIGTADANNTNASILDTIQSAINRVLGMLSFIALILCLWGGFQMLTAGGDDSKVKAGTKVLKNAGMGLAVIGLSWLIVSFVFRIVNRTSGATS